MTLRFLVELPADYRAHSPDGDPLPAGMAIMLALKMARMPATVSLAVDHPCHAGAHGGIHGAHGGAHGADGGAHGREHALVSSRK